MIFVVRLKSQAKRRIIIGKGAAPNSERRAMADMRGRLPSIPDPSGNLDVSPSELAT